MDDRIIVVDSPCGTGKTSWAINYMNELGDDDKVLYITPFLDECKRVQDNTIKKFFQPEARFGNGRKRNHFLELIRKGENIASTHALFADIDDEVIQALRGANYTLILDEAFQVLDKFDMWEELSRRTSDDYKDKLTKDNLQTLIDKQFIEVDSSYKVRWIDNQHTITKYDVIRNLADRGLIFLIRDSLLLWTFPCEIFQPGIFNQCYVLTYLFDYQVQRYYYDFFNIRYEKYHIEDINDEYVLIKTETSSYEERWRSGVKDLITICDNPRLNKIGAIFRDASSRKHHSSLSKSWYEGNPNEIVTVQKNLVNYFLNITKSKTQDRMWTCFEEDKKRFRTTNLSTNEKQWVALNSRSTNNYGDKSVLAYPLNRYMNPFHDAFFSSRDVIVNEEGFAISEFIQWLWRSRIRNGAAISLYLPSERMRDLLIGFLNNQKI